jgi:hypothetical protein
MNKALDAAMRRLDDAVAESDIPSTSEHQRLIDAFAEVATELGWDGFALAKTAAILRLRARSDAE